MSWTHVSFPGRSIVPLISYLIFAFVGTAGATPPPSPWIVRVCSCRGLADRTIIGIAQDRDGFLWFATPRQLARFDGSNIEPYWPTDLAPVQNRRIRVLLKTHAGALWLATDDGQVVQFGVDGATNYSGKLPCTTPGAMVEAADGSIWISFDSTDHTICRIKGGVVTAFSHASDGDTRCVLAPDSDNNVWYAAGTELGLIHDGAFRTLPYRVLRSARMAAARDGGIWIAAANGIFRATADGRVRRVDSATAPFASYPNVLLEDRSGSLWIGTSPDGLFHVSATGNLERIATSYPEIISLDEDREGNIWAGTSGSGVDCISRRAIMVEGDTTVLPQSAIQSVCEDADNVVWGCTQSGTLVQRTAAGTWRTQEGWPAGVTALAADPGGGIWIGTRKSALYRMRGGSAAEWTAQRGLRGHTVSGIVVAKDRTVWLSLQGPNAIEWLDNNDVLHETVPGPGGRVESLGTDSTGRVWVGLGKGRLLRIDGKQLVDATPDGSPLAPVRAIHARADGSLWLGYRGGGLGLLSDGHYTHFTANDGLFSNSVAYLVSDLEGWLWLGSDDGIFKVRLNELEAFAAHRTRWVQSVRYGPEAGLPPLQVTVRTWGCAIRTHDGRIWMPMSTALVIADPAQTPNQPTAPPVLITAVLADSRIVAAHRDVVAKRTLYSRPAIVPGMAPLRLPAIRQRLEFEFTAPSFAAPENLQFRYRLAPFDDDWVAGGSARAAKYTHLPPGEYVFRLQACQSDGVWSEAETPVAVAIAPLVWQTGWFRSVLALAFTAATAMVVRRVSHRRLQRKLRVLQEQMMLEKERSRIARDLHDDAGNRLTRIALLSQLALRDAEQPGTVARHLAQLAQAAREATAAFDEIVWAVNPRNDTLAELISYLATFAQQFCESAAIACELDVPLQVPDRLVPTDVRQNLFLATKEAINNAIRHAGASKLSLRIAVDDETLTITVRDDGRGLPSGAAATGADGLRNFQQRMADIGGTLAIESSPNAGTRLSFAYRWASRENSAFTGKVVL